MICPGCKRPNGPAARKCMFCGRTLGAAPAPGPAKPGGRPAAAAPAPAADDLLPDLPPARPASPAPSFPVRPRRLKPLRSGGGAAKATLGGALGLILVCGLVGMRVCRAANRIMGETVENKVVTIAADDSHGGTLEVDGSYNYTFQVAALDGPVRMAVSRIVSKDKPSEAEILKLMAGSVEVAQGKSHTLTGRFSTGHYLWIVLNESEKKPVQAKISFTAR